MSTRRSKIETILAVTLMAALAVTAVHCKFKFGGSWSDMIPSGRYSCACTCETHATGATNPSKMTDDVTHSDEATTCAASATAAEQDCPKTCKQHLEKGNASIVVDKCVVDPIEPVRAQNEGCTSPLIQLTSAKPAHATLEGPIDFGRSTLKLSLPEGDRAQVKLKGEISLVGGNYAGPVQVWKLKIEPVTQTITTNQNHTIKDLVAMNEGIWDGSMNSSGTFALNTGSKLSLSAVLDGASGITELSPSSYISGEITTSYRPHASGSTLTHALVIDGNFQGENFGAEIHLHVWITDCRPTINAQADCWGGIDSSGKFLKLGGTFGLLGSLEGQDLCNAVKTENPAKCYTTSGEFPEFYCDKVYLPPPSNQVAVKSQLTFRWTDASGKVISSLADDTLGYMPEFPLTLRVENQWGRSESHTFQSAPQGPHCPSPLYQVAWPAEGIFDLHPVSFSTDVLPKGWYFFSLSSSAEAELLARVGAEPDEEAFDCVSGGMGEPCQVTLEEDGDIHLRLSSPEAGVPFLLMSEWLGLAHAGEVAYDREIRHRTPLLPPGEYRFDIVGMGNADLYVRRGLEPTVDEFDCRPLLRDSNETCILTLHDPAEIHVMVRGRAPESFFELTASPF